MPVNIPAQICGLVGLVIILAAFQMKKRRLIVFQLIGYVFCLAEALFVGGWIGAVVTLCAMVRNVLMIIYRSRYDRELPGWITAMVVAAMWLGSLPFYIAGVAGAWYDYFPPALVSLSTVCAVNKNFYVLKAGAFVHETGFIVYHASVGAYIGIIRQIILAVGIAVSVVRMIAADRIYKNEIL